MASKPKIPPPGHPGPVAKDIIDEHGISARVMADAIGMSNGIVSRVLRGDGPVTGEMAVLFGVYFGNGPKLWLDMQAAYDAYHLPLKMKKQIDAVEPLTEFVKARDKARRRA